MTAGVLRGERARFQLFGDTMNTTARLESSGKVGMIHASAETAEYLRRQGKDHWIERRTDPVDLKGKGQMQTFWIVIKDAKDETMTATDYSNDSSSQGSLSKRLGSVDASDDAKQRRLVNWNVEMLARLIRQIVARRQSIKQIQTTSRKSARIVDDDLFVDDFTRPLDEVKEIIMLPEFDHRAAAGQVNPDDVYIEAKVIEQLRTYVTTISRLYYDNPFHCFEHASHVVMATIKLMSRIVAPDAFQDDKPTTPQDDIHQSMHDHTYGEYCLLSFSCYLHHPQSHSHQQLH